MDGIHLSKRIGIVGGGITGLISAYFLSLEGYKVDLYEKKTLLSETSSKTTKLIHGGKRYFENLQFHEIKNGIIESYAGVTPLIKSKAKDFHLSSRDFHIQKDKTYD